MKLFNINLVFKNSIKKQKIKYYKVNKQNLNKTLEIKKIKEDFSKIFQIDKDLEEKLKLLE